MAYHPHLLLPLPPTPGLQRKPLFMSSAAVCGRPRPSPHHQEGGTPRLNVMGRLPPNPPPPHRLRAACEAGVTKERLKEHTQAGPSARDLMQTLSSLGQGFCGLPISDRRTLRRMFDFCYDCGK